MMSIRRQLLAWLLGGLLAAIAVAAIGTYWRARDEANALFDHQLQEMVASLTDAPFAAAPVAPGSVAGADALVVQIWDRNGVQLYLSQPQRELPQHAQLGFTNLHTDGGDWRVFSALAGSQVIQVAQPMRARRELAASMALRTIVPLLAVMPLLGLLIWLIIARGLQPLERVAAAVSRRSPTQLEPLAERGLPREVRPLVEALNGLLQRLGQTLAAQRTFIADAAHELRTPLTAVHLQAQLAERATTDVERLQGAVRSQVRSGTRDAAVRTAAHARSRRAGRRKRRARSAADRSRPARARSDRGARAAGGAKADRPRLERGAGDDRARRPRGAAHPAQQPGRQRPALHPERWPGRRSHRSSRVDAPRSGSATTVPALPPRSASGCSTASTAGSSRATPLPGRASAAAAWAWPS